MSKFVEKYEKANTIFKSENSSSEAQIDLNERNDNGKQFIIGRS